VTLADRLHKGLARLRAGRRALVVVPLSEAEVEAMRAADATHVNVRRGPEGSPFACPCCASLTLPTRGAHELCPVCFWEDDGQDEHDADLVRGGPNGTLSLTRARANYAAFRACDRTFLDMVRPPTAEEQPPGSRRDTPP
jgi:hypothetical protein